MGVAMLCVGVTGSVGVTDGYGRGLVNVTGRLWAWSVWW